MKEIIITSSVLILCIMLVRILFKGKISGRLQYALWLLVALRLIIPASAQIHMAVGSLEEFRIMDLVERLEERFGDVTEQLEKPVHFSMSLNSPLAGQAAEFMLGEDLNLPASADGPTSYFVAGKIGLIWLDILRGIWIGGMGIAALWMIIVNFLFHRRLCKERQEFVLPEELGDVVGGQCRTKIYIVGQLASPCLYGCPGREVIYLTPDIAQDTEKLRHVLIHEMCHKKHGDSFWSILRGILVCVYWMNPLVWAAAVLSKRDCELACDEAALRRLGEEERIPYGETLLSIIIRKSRFSDIACTATTMTGSGRSVKERIRYIAEKPKVLGLAVAAALIMIMAVMVLVFTKNPQFRGGTWGGGEITVTSGDLQVKLPETIAGISGYQSEDEDIIIYQVASGKEVGRFCSRSYGESVILMEEGREIVPLGDYGQNMQLKQYMNMLHGDEQTTVTVHYYTSEPADDSAGVPGTDVNDETTYIIDDVGSGGNPMLSKDWEVMPLEESKDYQPTEQMSEGFTDYLPNEQIAEESALYLPNEQITTIRSSGGDANQCYIYVQADYSGVADKYLEEMEYINRELEAAAGRAIVLSVNQEIRDEMFATLAQNRTEYLGDASKVSALVNALPQPEGLVYQDITLHTTQGEPLTLDVNYRLTADDVMYVDSDMMFFNAVMLFATIRNLDECNFVMEYDMDSASGAKTDSETEAVGGLIDHGTVSESYNRVDLEGELQALWSDLWDESGEYAEWIEYLYARLAAYLNQS